jgi:hypothetical protein
MNDEQRGIEPEDDTEVEGHKGMPGRANDPGSDTTDDVEGHRNVQGRVSPRDDDDDVEGHRNVQGRG